MGPVYKGLQVRVKRLGSQRQVRGAVVENNEKISARFSHREGGGLALWIYKTPCSCQRLLKVRKINLFSL